LSYLCPFAPPPEAACDCCDKDDYIANAPKVRVWGWFETCHESVNAKRGRREVA